MTSMIRDQVTRLRDSLVIDKNSLDVALQRQPQLFLQVSELFTQASAHRDFLKEEIARIDAELYAIHRAKIEKATGKATEAQVSQAVTVDAKHKEATTKFNKAKETADLAGALRDAFHQRRYMLQELCGLFVANYFQSDSVGVSNSVHEYRAQKNRDAIAAKRDSRKRL
jgi:hypothetical protein